MVSKWYNFKKAYVDLFMLVSVGTFWQGVGDEVAGSQLMTTKTSQRAYFPTIMNNAILLERHGLLVYITKICWHLSCCVILQDQAPLGSEPLPTSRKVRFCKEVLCLGESVPTKQSQSLNSIADKVTDYTTIHSGLNPKVSLTINLIKFCLWAIFLMLE